MDLKIRQHLAEELVGELRIGLIEIIWKKERKWVRKMSRASVTVDNIMLSNIDVIGVLREGDRKMCQKKFLKKWWGKLSEIGEKHQPKNLRNL